MHVHPRDRNIKFFIIYYKEIFGMKKAFFLLWTLVSMVTISKGQWVQQSSPVSTDFLGVNFTSSSNGWIVGRNGTILHTTNGGVNWLVQSSPTAEPLNKIVFIDSLQGYIVGDGNTILATDNGGVTWRTIYDGNPNYSNYYGITLSRNHSMGWIVGGKYSAGSTSILGMHLGYTAPLMLGYLGRGVGIDFIDEQVGWACGDGWWIMKTTNGGNSWIQQTSGVMGGPWGFQEIKFFNAEVGIAVGDSGVIQKTVNGGATWYNVRKKDELLFSVSVHNDSVAYLVGSKKAVMVTTNQGETWNSQDTPISSSITFGQVFFINEKEGWIVGSNGTILHTTNGGVTAIQENTYTLPDEFNLKPAYPNPFNPSTTLEFDIPRTSYISMKVYDIMGREVETLVNEELNVGSYTVKWDATKYSSGVYFYKLHSENFTEMKKMLLVR
jgi:photosystem II stability/assembly factor-like uncharacterized protein